ncbi:Uncharacterised protein [uncultured archaeon]|nr:Uncharacterised protein [uncultured archaeon]
MLRWYIFAMAALLSLAPGSMAQNPIDALTGSVQEKINAAGGELQQKAVQHIMEGNLTTEHIAQELNATKDNLTEQAKSQIKQTIGQNQNLNLTAEQLEQKAMDEIKSQLSQKAQQQPGFPAAMAFVGILSAAILIRRRM